MNKLKRASQRSMRAAELKQTILNINKGNQLCKPNPSEKPKEIMEVRVENEEERATTQI